MFLDKLDKAILRRLQEDSSVTNVELSESIGLSAPACFKRVKRLKEEGVISKEVAFRIFHVDNLFNFLNILLFQLSIQLYFHRQF